MFLQNRFSLPKLGKTVNFQSDLQKKNGVLSRKLGNNHKKRLASVRKQLLKAG